ncbi:MAG TPA: hypothetical protein VHA52_04505 [Candidatus Babeliaceae bacterium]|nr:hypothetical protein [Candidatus Babeliaceae bacterium]
MKTLTLSIALLIAGLTVSAAKLTTNVIVTTHRKQIRLTPQQLAYLQAKGTNQVKAVLSGDIKEIRNCAAADQIFALLGQ